MNHFIRKPCTKCQDGRWVSSAEPIFTDTKVALQLLKGEIFLHKLETSDAKAVLKLGDHPEGVTLEGQTVIWDTAKIEVDVNSQ